MDSGVIKYGQSALDSACAIIATAQSGTRNHVLNAESFGIGQLVGAGIIGHTEARTALLAAAKQCGIARQEAEATIESGLNGGMAEPRRLNGVNGTVRSPIARKPRPRSKTADLARELYQAALPLANSLAERYLREHRGIEGPLPVHFRFHFGVWHKEAEAHLPAMIAPITRTDAPGSRIEAIHVTYLDPRTGAKACILPAKKMFGACRGGAIWLGDYATHMLCAEGIEKGLACQHASDIPCAVGLSSTLLPHIVWPRGTKRVTLCADPNGAGEAAIYRLAKALGEDGIALDLVYPPKTGRDWDETGPDYIRAAIDIAKAWAPPERRPNRERKKAAQQNTVDGSSDDGNSDGAGTRPLVQIKAGDLARIVEEAEGNLIEAQAPFYRRGKRLVRPVLEETLAADERITRAPRLAEVDDLYMRLSLARHMAWEKFDKRANDWVMADPPLDIARTLNARYGDWKFPSVSGIIGTQTIRRDASLILEPGYDKRTGLILIDPPELPDIPLEPDRDDALDALNLLNELIAEFPFTGDGSRSVALSALITPVVRAALEAAPMHVTTAPQAGTGKSYVFDIAASIALGQLCPVIAAGKTEDEMEKRLGAVLMAGQPLISIDNVNGELGGELLCQAVERPLVTPRILGKSEIGHVRNRATFFATGNNLVLLDDMTRRAIVCSLDSGEERPELRRFGTKPTQAVLAERGPYIGACLTIVRAYHFAGRPGLLAPLASFEDWSNAVRSALVWLGEDDPIITMEKARDADPSRVSFASLVHAWSEEIGTGRAYEMTAAELVTMAEEGQQGVYRCPLLRETLHDIIPEKRLNSKSLGRWLSRQVDKVSGPFKLRKIADPKRGHRFYLDDPSSRLL